MKTHQEDAKRDYEVSAVHKIPSVSLKFDWTIENYNVEKTDGCRSPNIELPDVTLKFSLKRCDLIAPNRVNHEMLRVHSTSLAIYLSGKIWINGTKYSFSRKMASKDESILKILEITSPTWVVAIVFDLQVFYLSKKNVIFTVRKKYVPKTDGDAYRQKLHDYVQTLWKNPQFSDVRIDVSGGSIPAHKNILSARSPVFARMFQNLNVVENTENVVNVKDVSYHTMERLIGFLYGRSPDIDNMDVLSDLYEASDKYEVLYLRDMCGLALVDKMTPENACQLIELFHLHEHSELGELAINTCCMHLNAASETHEWRDAILANPKLTALVLGKLTDEDK